MISISRYTKLSPSPRGRATYSTHSERAQVCYRRTVGTFGALPPEQLSIGVFERAPWRATGQGSPARDRERAKYLSMVLDIGISRQLQETVMPYAIYSSTCL